MLASASTEFDSKPNVNNNMLIDETEHVYFVVEMKVSEIPITKIVCIYFLKGMNDFECQEYLAVQN